VPADEALVDIVGGEPRLEVVDDADPVRGLRAQAVREVDPTEAGTFTRSRSSNTARRSYPAPMGSKRRLQLWSSRGGVVNVNVSAAVPPSAPSRFIST
jgi:hypothetical protein